MDKFNLVDYTVVLLRLYKGDEGETSRLMSDLDYYFLEEQDKSKILFVSIINKTDMYIVFKTHNYWTWEKLNLIINNIFQKTTFMLILIKICNGNMSSRFWDELKSCVSFFAKPKKFRKKLKREEYDIIIPDGKTESKKPTIDDILNKINEVGIENLSKEETEILKTHKE